LDVVTSSCSLSSYSDSTGKSRRKKPSAAFMH
jgi:hypothetical protein